jgi:hypothetical protein
MKISKLIKKLEEIKERHGNIEVTMDTKEYQSDLAFRFDAIKGLKVVMAYDIDDGVLIKAVAFKPTWSN